MFENASGSYGYYPAKLRVRCSDKGCSGQTGWFDHGERGYDETPVAKGKAIAAWSHRAVDADTPQVPHDAPFASASDAEIARLTEALRAAEEREKALREALVVTEGAIAEYYRYWTGGETRGSYDGKPERAGLWKAQQIARQAIARTALKEQPHADA
jgi:hypothetical protein